MRESGEGRVRTHTLSRIEWLVGGQRLYNTASPAWGSVVTRRGGRGKGTKVQEGWVCTGEC